MLRCRLYPNKVGEVPIHKTSDGKLNAAHACCTAESINILLVESFIILNNCQYWCVYVYTHNIYTYIYTHTCTMYVSMTNANNIEPAGQVNNTNNSVQ